jgi:hypothetical protein
MWVDTARELAAQEMTVVRYDRRGTGETGYATMEFPGIHSPESNADVLDAVSATGAAPHRLMMTGVCSGAWNAAYGALHRGAKSVVMINVLTYSLRNVEVGTDSVAGPDLVAPGSLKNAVRRWLPYRIWLLVGRLGWTQVPEVLLDALRRKDVRVDLVLSPEDRQWFDKQRGPRGVARLKRRGWAETIIDTPSGDHALLQRDGQILARRCLTDAAARIFGIRPVTQAPVRVGNP